MVKQIAVMGLAMAATVSLAGAFGAGGKPDPTTNQQSTAPAGAAAQQSTGERARGQAPDAGRGAGRGGRSAYEPTLWLPDDQFLRWPFTDPQYAKIDGFKIKSYINEITAISRKSRDDGNQYWGRIAGTPYDKMTTDWVAAQYKRIGLEQVRVHE